MASTAQSSNSTRGETVWLIQLASRTSLPATAINAPVTVYVQHVNRHHEPKAQARFVVVHQRRPILFNPYQRIVHPVLAASRVAQVATRWHVRVGHGGGLSQKGDQQQNDEDDNCAGEVRHDDDADDVCWLNGETVVAEGDGEYKKYCNFWLLQNVDILNK